MRVSFTVFNNYAPLKQKLFEANYSAYISKGLFIWGAYMDVSLEREYYFSAST